MKTLWIIAMVCVARSALGEDLTLKEREVGTDVVEAVIDILGQSCVFSDDRHILRRIAKVETDDGNANDTFTVNGQDYYGGIWRVTQSMFDVAKSRSDLYVSIINAYDIDFSKADYTDLVKPLYSGLAARIYIDSTPTKGNEIPWSIAEQASYWALTYHQFSSSVTAQNYMYLDVIDLLASVCSVPRADIVFVLDGSSSIEAANFQTMLRFVQEVVENFDVEQDGVHIGVIQYSHFAETEFYLGEITDKGAVKTKVQSIEYNRGNTYTNASLDAMREMFAKYGRRASGVPQIGIVLTDGKSTNKTATVAAAQMVHDEKLTVFAIGVSGADISELNTIGTDPDCVHVHFLSSFTDMAPFTSTIKAQACAAPAELDPGYEFSGTLENGVRIFFKVKIVNGGNGTTITLKLSSGCGILYVSFKARKPGPAVYEHLLRVDSALKEGGRLYLTYPTDFPDEGQEFVEAFLALVGDCHVAANNFTIELNEGVFTEIITLNTTGTTEGDFNWPTNPYTTGTTKGNAAYGLQPVLLSLLAGLMLVLGIRA